MNSGACLLDFQVSGMAPGTCVFALAFGDKALDTYLSALEAGAEAEDIYLVVLAAADAVRDTSASDLETFYVAQDIYPFASEVAAAAPKFIYLLLKEALRLQNSINLFLQCSMWLEHFIQPLEDTN
ncbi:hypothetical protein I0D68_09095 [Pseudomonas lalucatii]|nr:hypothetical protein I0D68_09095 [Pseudomonas lalucatii]